MRRKILPKQHTTVLNSSSMFLFFFVQFVLSLNSSQANTVHRVLSAPRLICFGFFELVKISAVSYDQKCAKVSDGCEMG